MPISRVPNGSRGLDGSLFTAAHGYDGPGVNIGNNVYSIGTYGAWSWSKGTEADMHRHADAWAGWFEKNAPATDYFLYLVDESANTAQTEQWCRWILQGDHGPGQTLEIAGHQCLYRRRSPTFPRSDIPTSTLTQLELLPQWQSSADRYSHDIRKRFYMYNGHRPATGSFGD